MNLILDQKPGGVSSRSESTGCARRGESELNHVKMKKNVELPTNVSELDGITMGMSDRSIFGSTVDIFLSTQLTKPTYPHRCFSDHAWIKVAGHF